LGDVIVIAICAVVALADAILAILIAIAPSDQDNARMHKPRFIKS
jgi:hypothetical protein